MKRKQFVLLSSRNQKWVGSRACVFATFAMSLDVVANRAMPPNTHASINVGGVCMKCPKM